MQDLIELIGARRPLRIGIDGPLGAGKSRLARQLAAECDYRLIHLDDYLEPAQGAFAAFIDYPRLKRVIEAGEGPLIVEGVCLLGCLQRLGLEVDFLIYLQPNPVVTQDAVVSETVIASAGTAALTEELDQYQQTHRPQQRADWHYTPPCSAAPAPPSDPHAIDIQYLKSKTLLAMTLAGGGILAILLGAVLFFVGVASNDSAIIELSGIKISSKGMGGVVLSTSAIWAYLAYRTRPAYIRSTQRETARSEDGVITERFHETVTQALVNPERNGKS